MKYSSFAALRCGILLTAIALQGTHAMAQAQPAAKLVSRDELRTCMNTESDLVTRRKELEARGAKNRDEMAAIRADSAELEAEGTRLEKDQKPMERFNRKIKVHNTRIQAARDTADAFKSELETLNKGLIAYNEQCGGISFLPEDKEAILKEREAKK